jgi:hypothetical protein
MKESAQIFAIIMTIVFGFAAIANTENDLDERVQIVPCEFGIFKLVYLKKSSEEVQVSILNEDGETIKQDDIYASRGFVNIYDLHDFGTGHYTFRIQDSTGQVNHTIYYDEEMELAICQIGETGKYRLVAEELSNDISVDVFNSDSQLMISKQFNKGSVSEVFDLSKLMDQGDEVTFMIKEQKRLLKIATFQ